MWESLSERTRDIIGGIGWAVLFAVLLAIFVVDGTATGVVCTVLALLIVIAVKVTRIAKGAR